MTKDYIPGMILLEAIEKSSNPKEALEFCEPVLNAIAESNKRIEEREREIWKPFSIWSEIKNLFQ